MGKANFFSHRVDKAISINFLQQKTELTKNIYINGIVFCDF